MEIHGGAEEDTGKAVEAPAEATEEPAKEEPAKEK